MSFLNRFFINIFNTKMGCDQYGNKYYESNAKAHIKSRRRYILYNGICEPSKVPPMWHAWLHYMIDEVPKNVMNHAWQRAYLPNLTGTKNSYSPQINNSLRNDKVSGYNSWQPK
ncbi:MAG: NADH-ubiquinone oxidoreductase subunit NDUFA12 family protein [Janthinobacterium lividum]